MKIKNLFKFIKEYKKRRDIILLEEKIVTQELILKMYKKQLELMRQNFNKKDEK